MQRRRARVFTASIKAGKSRPVAFPRQWSYRQGPWLPIPTALQIPQKVSRKDATLQPVRICNARPAHGIVGNNDDCGPLINTW